MKSNEFKITSRINEFMNNITKKNKVYSIKTRIIICLVMFIIFVVSFIFSVKVMFNSTEQTNIEYHENGTFEYKVYLKPNKFYDQEYLSQGMVYVANLIKNFDLNLTYDLTLNEEFSYEIQYDVIAKLKITDSAGVKTIFEKDYPLIEKETVNGTGKNVNISENIVVDYGKYNQLATEFKNLYGVDSISNLIIYLKFNKDIKVNENEIDAPNDSTMSLTIPLTEKAVDIEVGNNNINESEIFVFDKHATGSLIIWAIIAIITLIFTIMFLLELLELLFSLKPELSEYDKYVNTLLREYDRLIAETKTFISHEEKEIVVIPSFEELLDIRDNLKLPIIYLKLIEHVECLFYISHDNTTYVYRIKASDFDQKEEK